MGGPSDPSQVSRILTCFTPTTVSANFAMDAPHTYMNPHQAQTDAVPITRILGIVAVGFTLISAVLFLCINWIIRVGKAEHAEKQKKLARKQE
ncbi:hypothetical protein KVV02_005590 [Mortierella alpina]|uniref:Uncharacterized protein n=1 Tax=Mortierella alpina TaxID=64518 RepID=A0A9P8A449_MORAP|nr:hypothetical protein KVV02_005590 [Mortierella alpina]